MFHFTSFPFSRKILNGCELVNDELIELDVDDREHS